MHFITSGIKKKRLLDEGNIICSKKPETFVKKDDDNVYDNPAVVALYKNGRNKKYKICKIKNCKEHKSYKSNNIIEYITTDFNISGTKDKFYFSAGNNNFRIFSNDKNKRVRQLVKCKIKEYMVPVYAVQSAKYLFIVLNAPPTDVGIKFVNEVNGTIHVKGNCSIIKIDLDTNECDVIFRTKNRWLEYAITTIPDSSGEPNVLIFSPNSAPKKTLPNTFKALLIENTDNLKGKEFKKVFESSELMLMAVNLVTNKVVDLLSGDDGAIKKLGIASIKTDNKNNTLAIKN